MKKWDIPELSSLRYILKKFIENDWKGYYSSKCWAIANGGYDCWFQINYNNQPIADCVAGDVNVWGFSNEDIENLKLCQYIVTHMPDLKKGISCAAMTIPANQHFANLTADFGIDGEDTFVLMVAIDDDNNICDIDPYYLELYGDNIDNITKKNYIDYIDTVTNITLTNLETNDTFKVSMTNELKDKICRNFYNI